MTLWAMTIIQELMMTIIAEYIFEWSIEWKGFEENGWKSLSLVDFSRIPYYSKIKEGISVKAHITNYFMIREKDWDKGE